MYNRSEIMKNAWTMYRTSQKWISKLTFSECLRRSWKQAKEDAKVNAMLDDCIIIKPEGKLFCRRGIVADYTMGWNITGITFLYRKELRSAGFKWDCESRCWYTTDRKVAENLVRAN